ncbi:2Fe-2S iron-sulfur cluster-binding protein [Streptomyces sp. NPDC046197]|uniref:2Fe-2S iron-sulfur cluster-binding protein n=1 Tax=Streptomyces sp. NPDC046197 TaxID=3154337 RepID=UPI00340CA409
MTDDQHGEGTPRGGGRWDPLPQGDYDDGATAFVKLPEGGIDALLAADSPLAAPGHGYVPPQITVTPASDEAADPAATGGWNAPGAPAEGARWPDPNAVPQEADANDRFTYRPAATQQWNFDEVQATQAGQTPAAPGHDVPGHDVTGQWSIPVADGDLPDESGEFTTSSLIQQWGGTPPATLPGGAAAPWATQAAGRPWGEQRAGSGTQEQPEGEPNRDGTHEERPARGGYPAEHASGSAHEAEPAGDAYDTEPVRGTRPAGQPDGAAYEGEPADGAHRHSAPSEQIPHVTGRPAAAPHPADERAEADASSGRPHPGPGAHPADQALPQSASPAPEPPDSAHDSRPPHGRDAEAPAGPRVPPRAGHGTEPEAGSAADDAQPAHGTAGAAEETQGVAEAAEGPSGPPARPEPAGTPGVDPRAAQEAARASGPAVVDADSAGPDANSARPQDNQENAASPDEPPPAAPHDEHPLASFVLRVNGVDRPVTDAWIGESLLYVLRERLGLAGAKDGCSQGECGACNVQVDGRLVASCLVPAVTAAGSEVRTVEGLAADGRPSDVQRALARCGAVQCGFCVPGMAMTLHDLLEGNPAPTELEARQALCGNLCRCSGYRGVLQAVQEVVAERQAHTAADGTESDADEPRIPHQAGPGAGGIHPSAFETPGPHDPYGQDGGQA